MKEAIISLWSLLRAVLSPRNIGSASCYLLGLPWSLLSLCFPKQDIIVFGARNGKAYDWNSRYLFEFMVKDEASPFQCHWITRNRRVFDELQHRHLPVLMRLSAKGIWTMLRARLAVVSSSSTDIDSNLVEGAIVIQVGHGFGLKKVGYAFIDEYSRHGRIVRAGVTLLGAATRLFDRQCRCDYLVAPSAAFVPRLQEDFRIPRDRIWVTGEPRMDAFNDPPSPQRLIAYVPTHRYHLQGCQNNIYRFLTESGFDPERLNAFMAAQQATFVLKFHHLHHGCDSVRHLFEPFAHLEIYEGEDAVPLLLSAAMLITDYSSVFCNFLCLNRPIVFAFFDYDQYIRVQGINNLLSNPPGPVVRNWQETEDAVDEFWRRDIFQAERGVLQDRLFGRNPVNSCQRIRDHIRDVAANCRGTRER